MLTRSKYKTCSPLETISTIQSILEANDIKTKIKYYTTTGDEHSCRLNIINQGLETFDIGVNGKGMSLDYATASAYGELMERLQNKAICRDNLIYATKSFVRLTNEPDCPSSALDFLYFPDECLTEIDSSELISSVIPQFFPTHLENVKKYVSNSKVWSIFAPFQNLSNNENKLIPVEWFRAMCSSTGLCAGNSREEALVQGINEICERYVLMKIYLQEYSLPSIPLDTFKGHAIYERISSLTNKYQIIIKDCSLGMGIPVLGLLFIKPDEGKYAFRLGADFNLVTALERCYTESFQGENASRQIFKTLDISTPADLQEYNLSLKNGTGRFPHWVLKESKYKPKFPHIDFTCYKDELEYYISLFGKFGRNIYVKDNSFLGFPAYSVYIPEFSSVDFPLCDLATIIETKNQGHFDLSPTMNISKAYKNNPDLLINFKSNDIYIELQRWNTSKIARVPAPIIKSFAYAMKGDYNNAHKTLNNFIEYLSLKKMQVSSSLCCAHDVLVSMEYKLNLDVVRLIYGNESVDKFCSQIQDVPKFFEKQWFPKCFQCDNCKIAKHCHFEDVIRFEQTLQLVQKQFLGYKNIH